MQAEVITSIMRPTVALADYDLLRATYDMLLRAPAPNQAAITRRLKPWMQPMPG